MALPPEVEASYSAIIDKILAISDLNTISAKRIRKGLQAEVDYDITPQKDDITQLIMTRFDKFNNDQNENAKTDSELVEPVDAIVPEPKSKLVNNGVVTSESFVSPKKRTKLDVADGKSKLIEHVEMPRPKKKYKKAVTLMDEDAAFAARLQAEENQRARSTRGGTASKKRAPVSKKPLAKRKLKSSKKINSDDDSDVDIHSDREKKTKRTGGFHKPMTLSGPLSELLGETMLSRPQTVKKIWEYVKGKDLQDPNDKRQIRCDDAMRKVFKQDRVHMFTMNKILNQNLYAQDE